MLNQSQESNNLKEITKGQYRDSYLIYNRRSTDDPDNQKNSIKYQKAENVRFAIRERLSIANVSIEGFCSGGIISEKHSAFKEDIDLVLGNNGLVQYKIERPKFYRLIQHLNKGHFKGVIVLCWDRISRNKGDENVIRKLMKSDVDFRFVMATYDKTSSGALHMDIDGMFAEHHSRVTSEKVTLTMRNQREKGICTYKAPVGYLNLGRMDHKPFDTGRAPIIKKLFEYCATGNWSLADLTKWAINQGFTMPPVRRRRTLDEKLADDEDDVETEIEPVARIPTFTTIQKILTNPFYTGKVIGNNGMYIRSNSHKALISEELFENVQKGLNIRKVSNHYIERLDHPLRGLVRCNECRRVYTPYVKKGIVYFGARCAPSCSNTCKSFNIAFITSRIGEYITSLSFTDEELNEISKGASTDIGLLENKRLSELEINERQKKKLREDLAYLRTNKLGLLKVGVYTPEKLLEEESNLNSQITKLQQQETISDGSMHETMRDVIKLSELLKTVYSQYIFASSHEKEDIIKLIFSELFIFEKELNYICTVGFRPFQNRLLSLGDPTGWLSEAQKYQKDIKYSIKQLEVIGNNHPPPLFA